MTWRATWAAAQITGVAVSSMVWLMLSALEPTIVAAVWLAGAVLVAMWPSRLAFRLRYGGRRVSPADRLMVLRAVAPVQQLRGRNQPEVRVTRRPGVGLAVGPRCLVVSHNLLDGLRSHRVTDLQFATLAARSVGTLAVTESRLVAAVGVVLPAVVVDGTTVPFGRRSRAPAGARVGRLAVGSLAGAGDRRGRAVSAGAVGVAGDGRPGRRRDGDHRTLQSGLGRPVRAAR